MMTSYDAVPYPAGVQPQTHPDRLAGVAMLFGLEPPPVTACRVLEIGCANGANLLPMAYALPGSQFTGIDLSSRQIASGQEELARLRLPNARLIAIDLQAVGDSLGQFDYIICHGVYSWVPPVAQEYILRLCAQTLSPSGVAYVSYNTLPGWRLRGVIRELMTFHAAPDGAPLQQVQEARDVLQLAAEASAGTESPYARLLRREAANLRRRSDGYIFHEHLERYNAPCYFSEMVSHAAAHGLRYLSESDVASLEFPECSAELTPRLRALSGDFLRQQQYLDFFRGRTFRQSLFVHADHAVDYQLRTSAFRKLHLAFLASSRPKKTDADEASSTTFAGERGVRISTESPLLASALRRLGAVWPQSESYPELLAYLRQDLTLARSPSLDEELAQTLLHLCATTSLLEISSRPRRFGPLDQPQPRASDFARHQAPAHRLVTNLRHQAIPLSKEEADALVKLDGTAPSEGLSPAMRAKFFRCSLLH